MPATMTTAVVSSSITMLTMHLSRLQKRWIIDSVDRWVPVIGKVVHWYSANQTTITPMQLLTEPLEIQAVVWVILGVIPPQCWLI
ncbi:hypothetical protein PC112_g17947 [Phytophthora cactorum]|nr:hypothetical protein PC112_g17947 [Phytophthora cactorum]